MPFFEIFSRKIYDYQGIYGGQTQFNGNLCHNSRAKAHTAQKNIFKSKRLKKAEMRDKLLHIF